MILNLVWPSPSCDLIECLIPGQIIIQVFQIPLIAYSRDKVLFIEKIVLDDGYYNQLRLFGV